MDLFHQTVSMKAVDNLNDFVRSHMLEPFDTRSRIDACSSSTSSTSPRPTTQWFVPERKLQLLDPLVAQLDTHDHLTHTVAELDRLHAAMPTLLISNTTC